MAKSNSPDPFSGDRLITKLDGTPRPFLRYYEYQTYYESRKTKASHATAFGLGYQWYLRCNGPDGLVGSPHFVKSVIEKNFDNIYDSSNGTRSYGVIYMCNKGFLDRGGM